MALTSIKQTVATITRPSDVESLIVLVRKLFMDDTVGQFTLDKSKTFITYTAQVPTEGAVDLAVVLDETIRNRPMEEYSSEEDKQPFRQLQEMCQMISEEGLETCYILVGNREKFSSWLKVRFPRTQQADLFGIPVLFNGVLPADVFILCGAEARGVYPTEIQFSVKGNLP